MSNYYSFTICIGTDCLRVFVSTEKKPVDIITITFDPMKTIYRIKEEILKETQIPVANLCIRCIYYEDEKSKCDIDDSKPLKHYVEEKNGIQYIFAKEIGTVNIKIKYNLQYL